METHANGLIAKTEMLFNDSIDYERCPLAPKGQQNKWNRIYLQIKYDKSYLHLYLALCPLITKHRHVLGHL